MRTTSTVTVIFPPLFGIDFFLPVPCLPMICSMTSASPVQCFWSGNASLEDKNHATHTSQGIVEHMRVLGIRRDDRAQSE